MTDAEKNTDGALVSPGSTATGSGTSMGDDGMGEEGTTEADVTDGRDQKLPPADGDTGVS